MFRLSKLDTSLLTGSGQKFRIRNLAFLFNHAFCSFNSQLTWFIWRHVLEGYSLTCEPIAISSGNILALQSVSHSLTWSSQLVIIQAGTHVIQSATQSYGQKLYKLA